MKEMKAIKYEVKFLCHQRPCSGILLYFALLCFAHENSQLWVIKTISKAKQEAEENKSLSHPCFALLA